MNVKKQLLLLVALVALLVGTASATDLSNDTICPDATESIAADTPAPEEAAVEEKSTPTMDVEKNTAEQKINKITREKKTLKTASSYDVETYQELRDALTNLNDKSITVNIKDNIKLEDNILLRPNINDGSYTYVTINGEGNTIDGDHQHYFLNIAQNVMVTINNLTVNNCTAAPSLVDGSQLTAGGAIINRDTLILNNTRFNNNHAELYGGAIWNFDNLIVDNSEFNNNTAHADNLGSNNGVGQGGAIYGGSLIVNNTRFNNNRAYTGGAISVNRYLTVDNTEFNNNAATYGGAIETSGTSTVTNTVFNNNIADRSGGAIGNGGTLIVNNTVFNNNIAHGLCIEDDEIIGGYMMSGGYGGAISNGGTGNLTVTNTEFNNNHADNFAGAIETTAYSNLSVSKTRFNNNSADWWGGAIYYSNASESAGLGEFHPHGIGSYIIADTTFYNNNPANFIIGQDNYIELKENDNYINVSNIAIIVDGEEIYNAPPYEYEGGEFDAIANCEIPEGNHLVKLIVNGTNIINNEYILSDTIDVTYQGLIDVIEGATMDMTLKLEEGLSYNMLETITLDKPGITITIDGNGQTINGMQNQVFHVNGGSSLVLKNITITNARSQEGGAIYNEGNLTIIDSTLTNNQATATEGSEHANAYGGAISNRDGSVTIIDSTLTNNQITAKASGEGVTVNAYGGAISNFYGSVTITDTTLNSNSATATGAGNWNVEVNTFGGAIYNTGTLTITDSTLENNNVTATATEEYATVDANALGAATYNDEYSTYNITGTTFYKNAPANIIINETTKKIELINDDYISIGKFTIIADGKEIGNGTGIDNLTQFTILDKYKNVEIVINGTDGKTLNNRYILRGFSVEVHNYTELVEAMEKAQSDNYNSYIINLLPGDYNATKSIIWEESETKNIIINANGVTLNGKGLYQFIKVGTGLNLKIENITLTNYRAANGGAIENHGTLNVTDSTLTNNKASQGGVLINYGNSIVTNSTFGNNDASNGTAIANFGNIIVTENKFIANTGNDMGSAIESLDNAIIEDNINAETSRYGSTIYTNGENVRITGNTFCDVLNTSITISTNSSNPKVNDKVNVTFLLKDQFDTPVCGENITITIDRTINITTNSEGMALLEFTTTAAQIGENTVTATYAGNDKYKESEATYTFEVAKADTNITITPIGAVKKGESVTITGTLVDHNGNKLANSVVRLLINNGRKTLRTDADGVYTFNYRLTRIGENTINATYEGSDFYNEATESITVEVKPLATTIVIDPMDPVNKGTTAIITGTLKDENDEAVANAIVKLTINGRNKTLRTDADGKFTHTYTMNKLGENTITAEFAGNTNYEAAETATSTVEVTKAESVITIDPVENAVKGSNVTFTGKLTGADGNAIANAQVKIMVNGSPKTLKTDASGVFSHTFKMTKEGTNNITTVFNGNNYYLATETNATFQVIEKTG